MQFRDWVVLALLGGGRSGAPSRQGPRPGRASVLVIKQQFGFQKTRYRGLAKNGAQLNMLFALSNLWMARRRMLPSAGQVRL